MKLEEALAMPDSYSGMLEVACLLEEKAANGVLTREEEIVRAVTWIDCQVCNGGWDQWMFNTPASSLHRTVAACREVGCGNVADMAERSLEIAGIQPEDDDDIKTEKLSVLSDASQDALSALSDRFYLFEEDYMGMCKAYILTHREHFGE